MNHPLHLNMVFAEQDLVDNFSRNSSTGDRQGEIKILWTLFINLSKTPFLIIYMLAISSAFVDQLVVNIHTIYIFYLASYYFS